MKPLVWAFWGHEPKQFYQRRHSDLWSQLGNGEWIPDWYDRLHTEEAIAKAAAMGVNEIYTHYYKGFGLKMEHDDMMRTAEVVQIAHKYGIKVIGYCTIGTYYYETLEDELPGAIGCAVLDQDGKIVHPSFEGGFVSRNFACYNASLYYDEYYPKLIEFGLKTVKLDGFHFDNGAHLACYCPRCVEGFREYLRQNVPDPKEYALHSFDHVALPGEYSRNEPLRLHYLKYRRELCARRHRKTFQMVKAINPEAIVLYNCGIGRFTPPGHVGYDPAFTPPEADQVFIETGSFINYKDGVLTTTAPGFKLGKRVGLSVLNTSWLHNEKSMRIPETAEEITLFQAESLVFGSDCGSNWLGRPLKSGKGGMVMDTEPHHSLLTKIFHYYLDHPELYAETSSCAKVKVLYHPDSRLMDHEVAGSVFKQVCTDLLVRHIPFEVVFPGDEMAADETLILPGVVMLSQAEADHFKSLPCRVIAVTPAGIYNDRGAERCTPAIPEGDINEVKSGFEVSAPCVMLETALTPAGEKVVHLIHYDNGHDAEDVTVTLPFCAKAVEAFSYEEGVQAVMVSENQVRINSFRTLCTLKFKE